MRSDLFAGLDRDWEVWCRPSACTAALTHWGTSEPYLAGIPTVAVLLELFERPGTGTHQARDEALLALLKLAQRGDNDARRLLLRVLRAGLVNLTSRASRWWGWEEACSAVLAAALDQVDHYPMRRTHRVAANLLAEVWHMVWVQRRAELRLGDGNLNVVDLDDLRDVPDESEPLAGR